MNEDAKEALCCLLTPISGLPNYYKYRALGSPKSEDFKHTKAMIMKGEIYLAKYSELNDPFEYRYSMSFEASENAKFGYFIERCKREYPHEKACSEAEKIVRGGFDLIQWEKRGEKKFEEYLKNQHGIFCVSTIYDDILMWSHYADKHTGVCVVFQYNIRNEKESIDFFEGFSEVNYENTIPEVNLYNNPTKRHWAVKVVNTKSEHWEYEKEYRFVPYAEETCTGCMRINPSFISGVIMGLRISGKNKELVLEWSKSRTPQFSVYQAVMNKNKYSLDIVPVRIA